MITIDEARNKVTRCRYDKIGYPAAFDEVAKRTEELVNVVTENNLEVFRRLSTLIKETEFASDSREEVEGAYKALKFCADELDRRIDAMEPVK